MRKKTAVELPVFVGLVALGAFIVVQQFRSEPPSDQQPEATPTPRIAGMLRSVPVSAPETIPSTPSASPTQPTTPEVLPEEPAMGMLVILVREADGTVPVDEIKIRSPQYPSTLPVEKGRAVLEVITGRVSFEATAVNQVETRTSSLETVTITEGQATRLELTLPKPKPTFISAGISLNRQLDGYWSIAEVEAGSPAATAGLQAGDAILAIGNQTPTTMTDAQAVASLIGDSGDRIPLQVVIRNEQGELEEHQIELLLP